MSINSTETIIKELVNNKIKTQEDLLRTKRKIAKNFQTVLSSNVNLLQTYHKMIERWSIKKSPAIERLLITRPVRSLSGIVNVSVLTKPYPCPGRCLYCPIEKGIPKSYVSGEPAVERAKRLKYDPYLQVKKRLEMLASQGHPTDKVEIRIVGGTWSYYPEKYQTWFIKRCFDACNERAGKNLSSAQKLNEKARHRMVGLSVETRPDFINEEEIKRLRKLGVTMVELGVQSIFNDVLKINLRGHLVKATIEATKLLKDAGFKVLYQMMPNLPGSNVKRDKEMFKMLFSDPDFQPDLLKIYPCALLKEAPLYRLFKKGRYKPYSEKQLINLLKDIKKSLPYYVRVQRIARDIPSGSIVAGPAKLTNLRQILIGISKKEGWRCRCIRCREVRGDYNPKEKLFLFRQDYEAGGGKEIFLSFENKARSKLFSLLRLRISSQIFTEKKHFLPVLEKSALIREIHTYGQQVPVAEKELAPQHRGLGRKLIREAEKIVHTEFSRSIKKEFGLRKITVIAAVGARDYFRKLGYKIEDGYMVKNLPQKSPN